MSWDEIGLLRSRIIGGIANDKTLQGCPGMSWDEIGLLRHSIMGILLMTRHSRMSWDKIGLLRYRIMGILLIARNFKDVLGCPGTK